MSKTIVPSRRGSPGTSVPGPRSRSPVGRPVQPYDEPVAVEGHARGPPARHPRAGPPAAGGRPRPRGAPRRPPSTPGAGRRGPVRRPAPLPGRRTGTGRRPSARPPGSTRPGVGRAPPSNDDRDGRRVLGQVDALDPRPQVDRAVSVVAWRPRARPGRAVGSPTRPSSRSRAGRSTDDQRAAGPVAGQLGGDVAAQGVQLRGQRLDLGTPVRPRPGRAGSRDAARRSIPAGHGAQRDEPAPGLVVGSLRVGRRSAAAGRRTSAGASPPSKAASSPTATITARCSAEPVVELGQRAGPGAVRPMTAIPGEPRDRAVDDVERSGREGAAARLGEHSQSSSSVRRQAPGADDG